MQSFLSVLDSASGALLSGLRRSPSPFPRQPSLAGAVLGIVFGLVAHLWRTPRWPFPFRVVVDVVRGTPVLVLILASYYMPSGLGAQPRPDRRRGSSRSRSSAPRMSARRCAARSSPSRRRRPTPAAPSA